MYTYIYIYMWWVRIHARSPSPPGGGFVQARTWVRGDTKPPRGGRGFRAYPHTQGRPSLCGMSAR